MKEIVHSGVQRWPGRMQVAVVEDKAALCCLGLGGHVGFLPVFPIHLLRRWVYCADIHFTLDTVAG